MAIQKLSGRLLKSFNSYVCKKYKSEYPFFLDDDRHGCAVQSNIANMIILDEFLKYEISSFERKEYRTLSLGDLEHIKSIKDLKNPIDIGVIYDGFDSSKDEDLSTLYTSLDKKIEDDETPLTPNDLVLLPFSAFKFSYDKKREKHFIELRSPNISYNVVRGMRSSKLGCKYSSIDEKGCPIIRPDGEHKIIAQQSRDGLGKLSIKRNYDIFYSHGLKNNESESDVYIMSLP